MMAAPSNTGRFTAMASAREQAELEASESVRALRAACREVTGGCRVLLVEDEVQIVRSLRKALVKAGHSVDVAHSLKEARTLVGPWDVGIFDYSLPDGKTTLLAQRMARDGTVRRVVSFSGTPRDEAPIGDHVLDKATVGWREVVALVTRLAAL